MSVLSSASGGVEASLTLLGGKKPKKEEHCRNDSGTPSGEGSASHPAASEPPAGEADFAVWLTAHAVPIGLVGLGVVALLVALGSLGIKRARHRNEVMHRYRP